MSQSSQYLLELKGMRKAFPGVLANDDIDLKLKAGEVHALLGENGAGKSTLVKMIYGILKPDAGTIHFNGELVDIKTPAIARELGVAMVFQHFSLFDSLTVVENISLGTDHANDLKQLAEQITKLSNRYGLPLDPHRHVYTLSVGERQRIEIIRCLLQEPKLLVMDEPTSVLTPQEVDKLFITLKRLSEEGMAILYISHKLDEIKVLCHNATILRLGKKVGTVSVADESTQSLAAMMMGEELQGIDHPQAVELGKVRLEVNGLNLAAKDPLGISLSNINLTVRGGEVVGLAGVAGNGQDELLTALNGEHRSSNDSIRLEGNPAGNLGPNERRSLGMASVPEKRLGHGATPDMSLIDNAFLTAYQRLGLLKNGLIDYRKTTQFAEKVIKDYVVKTPNADVPAGSLSGGNLQKFIVGRELSQNPDILIIAQPTWGVDAGAAQTIHQAIRELASKGAAVLIISQDLDELMEITDRIGAICGGVVSEFYSTKEMSIEKVGMLMAGVSLNGENKNVSLDEGVENVA
jgi:simple sugar transport system ATP-binding protein